MQIERLLRLLPDDDLVRLSEELFENRTPKDGYVQKLCRRINRQIDMGNIYINPNGYYRLYKPTLTKLIHKELAYRHVLCIKGQLDKVALMTLEESQIVHEVLKYAKDNN